MDPLSMVAAAASVTAATGKVVKLLHELHGTIEDAPLLLTSIINECTLIYTSLGVLHDLQVRSVESDAYDADPVVSTFDIAFTSCALILSVLERDVQSCLRANKDPLDEGAVKRAKVVLKKDHLQELIGQLRGQSQGLTLLLNTLQSRSIEEVKHKVNNNQDLLHGIARVAKKFHVESIDGASIADSSHRYTDWDIESAITSTRFAFDDEVLNSRRYQRALAYLHRVENRQAELNDVRNVNTGTARHVTTRVDTSTEMTDEDHGSGVIDIVVEELGTVQEKEPQEPVAVPPSQPLTEAVKPESPKETSESGHAESRQGTVEDQAKEQSPDLEIVTQNLQQLSMSDQTVAGSSKVTEAAEACESPLVPITADSDLLAISNDPFNPEFHLDTSFLPAMHKDLGGLTRTTSITREGSLSRHMADTDATSTESAPQATSAEFDAANKLEWFSQSVIVYDPFDFDARSLPEVKASVTPSGATESITDSQDLVESGRNDSQSGTRIIPELLSPISSRPSSGGAAFIDRPNRKWLNAVFTELWMQKQIKEIYTNRPFTRVKIAFVGDPCVGITSVIHRALHGRFMTKYAPTVLDRYELGAKLDGAMFVHELWDTAGEQFDYLRSLAYDSTPIVVVGYAVDEPDSLTNVCEKWIREVREHCPQALIFLLGCKADLRDNRKTIAVLKTLSQLPVTFNQGLNVARRIDATVFAECSAIAEKGGHVHDLFSDLTKMVVFLEQKKRLQKGGSILNTRRHRSNSSSDLPLLEQPPMKFELRGGQLLGSRHHLPQSARVPYNNSPQTLKQTVGVGSSTNQTRNEETKFASWWSSAQEPLVKSTATFTKSDSQLPALQRQGVKETRKGPELRRIIGIEVFDAGPTEQSNFKLHLTLYNGTPIDVWHHVGELDTRLRQNIIMKQFPGLAGLRDQPCVVPHIWPPDVYALCDDRGSLSSRNKIIQLQRSLKVFLAWVLNTPEVREAEEVRRYLLAPHART